MIVKTKEDRQLVFPQFLLSDKVLNVCNKVKYLEHLCTDVIKNLIFKFMSRLEKSENCILRNLVDSKTCDTRFFSKIWAH